MGIVMVASFLMVLPYSLRQINRSDQPVHEKEQLTSEQTQPAPPKEVGIDIVDFKFASAKVTVKKGTSVEWTNKDSVPHTVTGDTGGPDSPLLARNESYRYTFNQTGVFNYHCKPHPFMKGVVEVVE